MPETYGGVSLTHSLTRDSTTATSSATQTWKVHAAAPVKVSSFVCDIRSAADYQLKVDGVTVATVAGVSAGQASVEFAPAGGLELAAGTHTFQLVASTAVTWYSRGNYAAGQPGGTGFRWLGWDVWEEPAAGTFVPGVLTFRVADWHVMTYLDNDSTSSGSFEQTWSLTFSAAVELVSFMGQVLTAEPWSFLVDGVTFGSYTTPASRNSTVLVPFVRGAGPLALAAGAHTVKLQAGGARQRYYRSGSPGPTGNFLLSAWGGWAEASGNKVGGRVVYKVAPIADPRDISGLKLWLSAASITGKTDNQNMDTWSDLSGNGNHCTAVADGIYPKYRSALGPSSGPCVYFNSGYFSVPSGLLSGCTEAEMIASLSVENMATQSGWNKLTNGANDNNAFFTYSNGQIYDTFATNTRKDAIPPTVASSGQWWRYGAYSAAGDWRAYGNGQLIFSTASNTVSIPTADLRIGSTNSGFEPRYHGWVAAFIVYGRKLTDVERAQLDSWLAANPTGGSLGGGGGPSPVVPTSMMLAAA